MLNMSAPSMYKKFSIFWTAYGINLVAVAALFKDESRGRRK